jgi:4-amino-4-deoxychorismate lyase
MRPDVLLVDGEPISQLSALDRGLHYGDGLFETIACQRGRARFVALHLKRLAKGCERFGLCAPDMKSLREKIDQLVPGDASALIKLIVTRGRATARGYRPRGDEQTTQILLRYPASPEDPGLAHDGIVARVGELKLGENPALAGIKHLNRLEQVLASRESDASGALESLLFSSSGRLISGTMSNVFLVRDNEVATPRLDLCGVEGVMRSVVMREAARAQHPIQERALWRADLDAAQEIFLTNARIGIWPVRTLEGRTLTPGPVTRRLQQLLQPLLEAPADA